MKSQKECNNCKHHYYFEWKHPEYRYEDYIISKCECFPKHIDVGWSHSCGQWEPKETEDGR